LNNALPTKVIAGCMGLSAFVIAIVAGLSVGNPASETLLRALVAMVICQMIGVGLGWLAESAIAEIHQARGSEKPGAGVGTPAPVEARSGAPTPR
jgi:putative Mn2+ efflux pump MntP